MRQFVFQKDDDFEDQKNLVLDLGLRVGLRILDLEKWTQTLKKWTQDLEKGTYTDFMMDLGLRTLTKMGEYGWTQDLGLRLRSAKKD